MDIFSLVKAGVVGIFSALMIYQYVRILPGLPKLVKNTWLKVIVFLVVYIPTLFVVALIVERAIPAGN